MEQEENELEDPIRNITVLSSSENKYTKQKNVTIISNQSYINPKKRSNKMDISVEHRRGQGNKSRNGGTLTTVNKEHSVVGSNAYSLYTQSVLSSSFHEHMPNVDPYQTSNVKIAKLAEEARKINSSLNRVLDPLNSKDIYINQKKAIQLQNQIRKKSLEKKQQAEKAMNDRLKVRIPSTVMLTMS